MFKAIVKRYKEGRAQWDNKDGYVQPMMPYWVFLMLMTTPAVLLAFLVYEIVIY